jgi:CheY-like chemotaxis protein
MEVKMGLPTSLLWVDDQIDRYMPWITKFSEYGTKVDSTDSLVEGLQKLDEKSYDVVLFDAMMGHESCIHVLPEIHAKARGANLFVCSAFFYLPDVIAQLGQQQRAKQVRIGRLDKTNLPFPDDENGTLRFLEDLNAAENVGESFGVDKTIIEVRPKPTDAKTKDEYPSWDVYNELDARGKIAAIESAAIKTKDIRRKANEAGYRYLVFCGSWTKPLIQEKTLDELPTQDEVVEKARTLGYAPFVFSIGGSVDDVSSGCSERSGLRSYPVLRITFRKGTEEVHFDTGNPYTLLSYEWYVEKGWLPVSRIFDMYTAGEMELIGNHFRLPEIIVTDAAGEGERVTLTGFLVTGWNSKRLATPCLSDCTTPHDRKLYGGVCRFRTGLLGRNLAQAIPRRIKVDFRDGRCFFCEVE